MTLVVDRATDARLGFMIEWEPAEVVRALGGSATAGQLAPYVDRRRLAAEVSSGRLCRVARGIYTMPTLPDPQSSAAALRGVLSHESAAQYLGMDLLRAPDRVHVSVRRGSVAAPPPRVVVHQSRGRPPSDDGVFGRQVCTAPVETVLDCATTLPFADALAIADSALSLRFMTAQELVSAATASAGRGRPQRIKVAAHAHPAAANPLESALRAIVVDRGLHGFVPQCAIPIRRRVRGGTDDWHVDLGDERWRIALEAEGYATHGTRQALAWGCERYDELVRRDWVVLRFAWEHVLFRPTWVGDVIADTCALRRGTGR